VKKFLFVVAAAFGATGAAQAMPSHSIYVACKYDPGGGAKRTVHYSPIGKATIPWLPKGSSNPNTAIIISGAFRDVVIDRGNNSFYKAECYGGEDIKTVRGWIERFADATEARAEIKAEPMWAALTKWMVGMHRSHGASADMYRFEPAEPVSEGMAPSDLF
jgi:hypothetical protein